MNQVLSLLDKTSAWYGSLDIWIVVTDMDYNVLFDISSGGLGNDYLSEASVMNNLLSISTFSYSGISGSKEIDNEDCLTIGSWKCHLVQIQFLCI